VKQISPTRDLSNWLLAWRLGFARVLSDEALRAIEDALYRDSAALIQRRTTSPDPVISNADEPCTGACLVSYGGLAGHKLLTVGQVERYFAACCQAASVLLDEHFHDTLCFQYFLNWFDDTPRDEVRAAMLAEVRLELFRRKKCEGLGVDLGISPVTVRYF